MSPSFSNVRYALSLHHVAIRRDEDEFRVSLMELRGTSKDEAASYYTNDLEDALLTGIAMRVRQASKLNGKALS